MTHRYYRLIQNGTFEVLCCLGHWMLNGHSPQDTLGASFRPIKLKDKDVRRKFYAMCYKEMNRYDTEQVKGSSTILDTIVNFVSLLHPLSLHI